MLQFLKDIFGSLDRFAVFVSAIAALMAAVSAVAAVWGNRRSQRHYKDSIRPQLSMKLIDYKYELYLYIKNTGRTAAKNISIQINSIENNGDRDLNPGKLFEAAFELYPEESVQETVAYLGTNIAYHACPKVGISVEYTEGNRKKKIKFSRTVSYFPAYSQKVSADVNLDTSKIDSSLASISRAAVRTANYLDGKQIASFDNLEIISRKTLENDLRKSLGKDEVPVMKREEVLHNHLGRGEDNNAHT
ncbi:hypothetical protein [Lachnoclostridium sp. MSJ-17]|uniref:hypothetical protein n=1 Tax=Lachnoclostridium sp. MSJ-17 TaxID=2841516 RepID=UPI001C10FE89|nr:hypothetical protein [Lachnoclostridium sp. MSJ-17]MBU5462705.1 hypothetical protein [Lachnoclostridium sp. MSJ-17]